MCLKAVLTFKRDVVYYFFIFFYIFQTSFVKETEELEEEATTLEKLLSRVGLQDKVSTFQQEQIDLDALVSSLYRYLAVKVVIKPV